MWWIFFAYISIVIGFKNGSLVKNNIKADNRNRLQTDNITKIVFDGSSKVLPFHPFQFHGVGTFSQNVFEIQVINTPAELTIFDCFCGGDQLSLFVDGNMINNEKSCPTSLETCNNYSNDPHVCYVTSEKFCRSETILQPGKTYKITIKTKVTYYNGGIGFLSLSAV